MYKYEYIYDVYTCQRVASCPQQYETMAVYMFKCMYIRTYAHIVYVHTYICTHRAVYICEYMYIYIFICTYVNMKRRVHIHMVQRQYTYINICTYTHAYTLVYTYVHIYIYTYIHPLDENE